MISNDQLFKRIEFAVALAADLGQFNTPEDRERVFAELRKDPRVAAVSEYGGEITISLRAEVHKIDINVLISKGASDD